MKTKNEFNKLLPFYKELVQLNNIDSLSCYGSSVNNSLWDIHYRLCHEQNMILLAGRHNDRFKAKVDKAKVDIEELKGQRRYIMPYDYPYNDFYLGRKDINDNHIETLLKRVVDKLSQ